MTTASIRTNEDKKGFAVDNLRFSLTGKTIMEDLRLHIDQGEFVCLYGPGGTGKTTLLRLLAGLEIPAFGRVSWNGRPVAGQDLERGLIFQDCGLLPWLSLVDNLVLALDAVNPNMPSVRSRQLAGQYLAQTGLAAVGHKNPLEITRDQRQRGSLARALALESPALLIDDPFCVLDPSERAILHDLLTAAWADGKPRKTVVLATQDLDEALYLADRIIGLGPVPGPVIVDVPITIPRPRERNALYAAPEFQTVRRRINDLYRQERRQRVVAAEFFGLGEGI
ncbi:MAG: ABC transporter ATP-binding protein [Solidesulfovibrio sp.]